MNAGRKNKNKILAGLSKADTALLQPLLTPVELPVRKLLEARGRRIEQVYFLDSGLASIVASGGTRSQHRDRHHRPRRHERPSHSHVHRPLAARNLMQSAGTGWRIAAADLSAAMSQSATLRERLLRYAHTVAVQMGFTALSNGRYKLEERLARWLLMALDRSDDNAVTLTHEFLAVMLGTRRPGITTALNVLEKSGLIESRRGLVKILNRGALEETANGSYGAAEAEYARLFGAA